MANCVSAAFVPDSTPRSSLTHEEIVALSGYIREQGGMDAAGTFGFLNAIASSPFIIPVELWQPSLNPTRHPDFHRLLCIASDMVGSHLASGCPLVPVGNDFESFARGYLAGLALWPLRGREHFRCAPWACLLARRLDLLPRAERELFETDPPAHEDLADIIACSLSITYDLFIDDPAEESGRPAVLS